jgi:hypothetical protein
MFSIESKQALGVEVRDLFLIGGVDGQLIKELPRGLLCHTAPAHSVPTYWLVAQATNGQMTAMISDFTP